MFGVNQGNDDDGARVQDNLTLDGSAVGQVAAIDCELDFLAAVEDVAWHGVLSEC